MLKLLKVGGRSRPLAWIAFALVFSIGHLLGASEIEGISIISPDGTLELYESPEGSMLDVNGAPYIYGTKLYLRQRGLPCSRDTVERKRSLDGCAVDSPRQ